MDLDAIHAELNDIRESTGLPLVDFKAGRTPLIRDGRIIERTAPAAPAPRRRQTSSPSVPRSRARVPTIVRGQPRRQAVAGLIRKPGSKINPKTTITPREWLDRNTWVGVVSSNVRAIRYDKSRYDLYVRFKNGAEYRYPGVDRGLARRMYQSASMGKFVWRVFRWPGRAYQRVK